MGCDGGTIPKRNEIVKNKERRPRQERDRSAVDAEKWKNCAICDWILTKPIVAGQWGHIFSKECVLKHLIELKQRESLLAYDLVAEKTPILDSLHSMKDVKELKLKENTDSDCSQASNIDDIMTKPDFVCPITGLTTNGKYKFVFSWNCGCVVSERAVKEVPNEDKCLVCQTPYRPFDLVVLNPNEKDLEENQSKFLVRKMSEHLNKEKSRFEANSSQSSSETSGWANSDRATTSKNSSSSRRRRQGHKEATAKTRGENPNNKRHSPSQDGDDDHNSAGPSTSSGKRQRAQ
jgi:hypothetical protein